MNFFEVMYPDTKNKQDLSHLNELDKLTVQNTQDQIARYIGHITWIPYDKKIQADREEAARQVVIAAMEKKQSSKATQATEKAVNDQAEGYPKTPKVLNDTIDERIELSKKQKPKAKAKKQPAPKRPTNADTNDPPPEQPPPKRQKTNQPSHPKGRGGKRPPPTANNTGNPIAPRDNATPGRGPTKRKNKRGTRGNHKAPIKRSQPKQNKPRDR